MGKTSRTLLKAGPAQRALHGINARDLTVGTDWVRTSDFRGLRGRRVG